MTTKEKLRNIASELKGHAPFTLFGASTGIICMLIFRNLPAQTSYRIFYVFHPTHVVLSAMVTAAMFKLHKPLQTTFYNRGIAIKKKRQ